MEDMEFIKELDAEILKAELIEYLNGEDEEGILSAFSELFVDYMKEDFLKNKGIDKP